MLHPGAIRRDGSARLTLKVCPSAHASREAARVRRAAFREERSLSPPRLTAVTVPKGSRHLAVGAVVPRSVFSVLPKCAKPTGQFLMLGKWAFRGSPENQAFGLSSSLGARLA
jgi:hypothetical protein